MTKDINNMTREDFENIPLSNWKAPGEIFDSLIILPGKINERHDSGFRCMSFILVKDNKAIDRVSGCSDVIHIDGIGGYGKDWFKLYDGVPNLVEPSAWSIDCLLVSGLLRIWPAGNKMTCGNALSSFEIYKVKEEKK